MNGTGKSVRTHPNPAPLPWWNMAYLLPVPTISWPSPLPSPCQYDIQTPGHSSSNPSCNCSNHLHCTTPGGMLQVIPLPPQICSQALQLNIPPVSWAEPLWYMICPHAHNGTLQSALLTKGQIVIVSDAAICLSGYGSCTWTIWSGTNLWSREGYTPSLPSDLYSSLAEAYGLYVALSFLVTSSVHTLWSSHSNLQSASIATIRGWLIN